MDTKRALLTEEKITVLFSVEAGCLGPDGNELVEGFCDIAQNKIEPIESDYVHWIITPRTDKTQPETQFKINGKFLTRDKAEKYLGLFKIDIDELESRLFENITDLVEEYLGREITS